MHAFESFFELRLKSSVGPRKPKRRNTGHFWRPTFTIYLVTRILSNERIRIRHSLLFGLSSSSPLPTPLTMGKKGKRAGKAGSAVAKQGPGKARRELATAIKGFEKRLDALTETLVAELQGKDMFPPLDEQKRRECPLCLKPLPLISSDADAVGMMACCGQMLCMTCKHGWDGTAKTKFAPCPLCRSVPTTDTVEAIKWLQRRAESSDGNVVFTASNLYFDGCRDEERVYLKPDSMKSFELKLRAAELRNSRAVYWLGHFNLRGPYYSDDLNGIKRDIQLGIRLIECAARIGSVFAHHELGNLYNDGEHTKQDHDLSAKHFTYAACCGYEDSLEMLRDFAREERIRVDEFVEIEKACHEANGKDDEESTASDDE